jgi:5-(aminomethyl)-3-furanmethanol phosphate kinase
MTSRRGPGRRAGPVVKLGGSLLGSPHLPGWLDALAASRGAAIVVAGGGPFADTVREAQRRRPFSDSVAHRMAILAMEQYALMLVALDPALRPAASRAEIAALRRAGRTPVWLPSRMTFGAENLPESWDLTSDSLAVWLADALCIHRVLLVKSATLPAGEVPAAELAKAGIVDPLLPEFLRRTRVECRCIRDDRAATFAAGQAMGTHLTIDV